MAGPLADALFFFLGIVLVIAHVMIIRSTLRTLATAGVVTSARVRIREIVWAVLPAIMLAALLVWTWRTMHPDSMTFRLPADHQPLGGIRT